MRAVLSGLSGSSISTHRSARGELHEEIASEPEDAILLSFSSTLTSHQVVSGARPSEVAARERSLSRKRKSSESFLAPSFSSSSLSPHLAINSARILKLPPPPHSHSFFFTKVQIRELRSLCSYDIKSAPFSSFSLHFASFLIDRSK